jgi:hypothetical protein
MSRCPKCLSYDYCYSPPGCGRPELTAVDVLCHTHTDRRWRDREGDVWRYSDVVGWCWSRFSETDGGALALDQPAVPLECDGPFVEVGDE